MKRGREGAILMGMRALSVLVGVVILALPSSVAASQIEWTLNQFDSLAVRPGSPDGTGALEFVLDDGSAEGAFGVAGSAARQFMWFNQFEPGLGPPYLLDEVWVLFPPDQVLVPGDSIEIVIYADPDGDPMNGAVRLAAFSDVVQANDGSTFSIYPLVPAVEVAQEGDLLIGVINRYVTSGVTPPTTPAAMDLSASQARSWVAVWSGDPPATPELDPDDLITLVDVFEPGNFMIRAYGSLPVPTLPWPALVMLGSILGSLGALLIRRL